VEKVLDDNKVQAVVTLANAPSVTASILLRIEGGLCIASLGGNEGKYPGTDHEELMKFAREVRLRDCAYMTFGLQVAAGHSLTIVLCRRGAALVVLCCAVLCCAVLHKCAGPFLTTPGTGPSMSSPQTTNT
jgi:hypothetical protein